MAHQHHRGRYHPSRISGTNKFLTQLAWLSLQPKKIKSELKKIDPTKSDWNKQDKWKC